MKKVFEIPIRIWNLIGQKAIQLERNDIRNKGIFQDGSKHRYKSKTYAKYKKNDMRKFGRGVKKVGKGEKLKQYKGISISSRRTDFVDFTLTGAALNNMNFKLIDNGVRVYFNPADAGKVLGAEDNGRVLLNLRDANIEILENTILKQIDANFKKLGKKIIHIHFE